MCHQPLCYFWKTAFRCHTKLIIICVDIITLTKLTLIDMRIYVWTLVYDKQWFLPLAAEMDGIFEMIQILYNIHGYIIFRPLFHQLKFPCRQHSYECSLQCIVYVYRCSWRWMMMMMMIHPNPVMNCKWAFCFFFSFLSGQRHKVDELSVREVWYSSPVNIWFIYGNLRRNVFWNNDHVWW